MNQKIIRACQMLSTFYIYSDRYERVPRPLLEAKDPEYLGMHLGRQLN